MQILIQTDGASRGNPGLAAYGFVIFQDGKVIYEEGKTLGVTTNNVAEYTALKEALLFLRTNDNSDDIEKLTIQADSLLVIKQLTGEYKIKSAGLIPIYSQIKELLKEYPEVSYEHIRREFNKKADSLCNMALDGHI